jgi:outer membrane immunogenic protein
LENDWLVGIEGEWNYIDASDSANPVDNRGREMNFVTLKVTQDWEASLRARVGKVMGDYLPYITGGVAWTGINGKAYVGDGTWADDDQILVGWTIGAGVEMAINENVHARIQYRYTDYGDEKFDTFENFGDFYGNVDYNSHMLTVGLSYRF